MNDFKLDIKRTTIIGFAFFGILMTWQIYNTYAPLFLDQLLKDKFDNQDDLTYVIGIIMALDNLFALILLPIFGRLSDRTKTPLGKRMPYILIGLVTTAVVFPFIAVMFIYNSLVGVIAFMLLTLVIMNIYRSPAVSLMPDITPKPLRSKANGIINLIGYTGAIIGGGLVMVFGFNEDNPNDSNIIYPFIVVSVFLVLLAILLVSTIKENKLIAEKKAEIERGELFAETNEEVSDKKGLSSVDKRNFALILVATLFWFMSFNAIETYLSMYAKVYIDGGVSTAGLLVIILTVSSILTFIPAGILSVKFGRKNSVIFGLVLLVLGIGAVNFVASSLPILIVCIVLIGIGWATINLNSYPMIIEMAHKDNVGTYTGYYYIASMVAQTITPVLVGFLVTFTSFGLTILFPYATVAMITALFVFLGVKSFKKDGVTTNQGGKSLLESFDVD